MNSPIQDRDFPFSPRSKQGSLGWSLPLKGWGFGLFFGSLVWAGWASQLQLWAQPVEQQPQEEVLVPGRNLDPGAQIRVRNELVKICGDYRCEDYRFSVRVPIRPEDTLETLLGRLDTEMLREVDRVFQTRPDLNRVIVDGYVFSGTPAFVSREVLLQTMFVPRHRWEVGRFGPEQDAIFYAELLGQVTPFLAPSPTPTPTPGPVPGEAVPPLPPPPGETPPIEATPTPQETPAAPPPPQGDVIQRQPIQP